MKSICEQRQVVKSALSILASAAGLGGFLFILIGLVYVIGGLVERLP